MPDISESELSDSEAFTNEILLPPVATTELPPSDEDWLAKLLVDFAFSKARTVKRERDCLHEISNYLDTHLSVICEINTKHF